jgi:oxygen-independent coproporphyrinogen-3 oxidase
MMLRSERAEGRNQRPETIYLGGGTPSQLTTEQLRQLFKYINKVYGLDHTEPPLEVTIEMNPDDVTVEYAAVLQQLPINRVSLGAQTFDDQRLRFLHRRHTAAQVSRAVCILRSAGIRNISIDLMYGFPDETLEDWERDIDAALALNVEHISAYCLTVEEGTALYRMNVETVDDELEREMYYLLKDKLEAAGFEHYEISNFARPGYRSRHNSSYWQDVPYIGLGAAAHSYDGKRRSWNVADIRQYIAAVERGERPCEEETIDEDTWYNDRITTALRTREGLDLTALPEKYRRYCLKEARRYFDQRWLTQRDGHLALTRDGLFVSDDIMSSLIYI